MIWVVTAISVDVKEQRAQSGTIKFMKWYKYIRVNGKHSCFAKISSFMNGCVYTYEMKDEWESIPFKTGSLNKRI